MTLGACGRGQPAPDVLNIYSWTDYIAPDTVANFEKETGIKVRYDTYDSNEVLETKLLTGHTNYDVVVPTDSFFDRLRRAGVFRVLDQTALSNRSNLDPDIMRDLAVHDPGNERGVPYLWSTLGIGYDSAKLRARLGAEPIDAWSIVFDPKQAARLQNCGITVVDSPVDLVAAALLYLGKDPNSRADADLAAAEQALLRIRPYVRDINTTQYISDLANGSTCLAVGWSGDIIQARTRAAEAHNGLDLRYVVPREGSLIIIDIMGIPADAPHPKNAQLWLNYLMRPAVMAGITNAVKYPNGNRAALPLVDPAVRNDTAIYPDSATRAKLHPVATAPPEYSRALTRVWTRFRTGQ